MNNPTHAGQSARCPRCGQPANGLIIKNGTLCAGETQVLAWWCAACGKTVHWGQRGNPQSDNSGQFLKKA